MEKNKDNKIKDVIVIVVLIIGVCLAYIFYSNNNLNNFSVSEKHLHTSKFSKDTEVKYLNQNSYKITSNKYNDAMFSEKVKLEKYTPYKVSCMVKTRNVESKSNLAGSGAQISIADTTERSKAVAGTSEWQEIEMIFNSKDREEANIGFRLGGYVDECIGEAWFANFKVEKGVATTDNSDWRFACFVFDNVDATVKGKNLKYSLTEQEITDMKATITRFEKAAGELSEGKMSAQCDVFRFSDPITTLSYDEEYGYYAAPEDVEDIIKNTVEQGDYDHIFIIFKLGDEVARDWVGLGSMDYYGIGYSNVRLPNRENNYMYKYDARINTFPEEVLLHEFLHSLERTLNEYNYDIPALHDYRLYNYQAGRPEGLKKWYADYMNCNITADNGKVGLNSIVYVLKPPKASDFINSTEIKDVFYEPQNVIENVQQIFNKIGIKLSTIFA